MAMDNEFDMNTTFIRPHVLDDLIACYDDAATAEYEGVAELDVVVPIKDPIKANVTARHNYLKSLHPEDAALHAQIDAETATILAYIDSLANTVTGPATVEVDTGIKGVLQQVKTDVINKRNETLSVPDGRCANKGRYPKKNDTGIETDTQLIHCKGCNGWGTVATDAEAKPTIIWNDKPSNIYT